MRQVRHKINKIVEKLLIFIFAIMVINVIWQIFARHILINPSSFTDELARYSMIWLGILGAAYVSGRNEHVSIDYFSRKLSSKYQKIIHKCISLSIIIFSFFVMVVGGLFLVYITLKLEQYSPSLQIPLGLVYTIIPMSGVLIIFYKISNIEF